MIVGVPRESYPGERRVALVPTVLPALAKLGIEVILESRAGEQAGYPDEQYSTHGAKILPDRAAVFAGADIVVQVLCCGANDLTGEQDLPLFRAGQALIGFLRPLGSADLLKKVAATKVTSFAVELMPRITRAQSMDALSSMSTVSGYKAVLIAADAQRRFFPMLTTAAGTITPARVLIIGVGVAGLQAIATARRLGAVVSAYDVRPAVKEQVQSLGARFVELAVEAKDAQDSQGYARAQDETFYQRQRELLGRVIQESDVVITTAVIPGKKAPLLVPADAVRGMTPGSVIVDLAAERGGNCEMTQADKTVVEHGVTILGPTDLPSQAAYHASQMFAKNAASFLLLLTKDGQLQLNMDDEIVRETLVARDGQVVHPRIKQLLTAAAS